MIDAFIRFLKRFIVLVPGLLGAYLVATDVYPVLDKQIPAALAILVAYVIAAYVVIPALLRIVRFFFPPKHIPHYCVTPDGFASDPINIGVVGTRKQVTEAMQKAGWYTSDKRSVKSILRMIYAILLHKPYPTAPFSSLYLFGRKQDLGFQLPIGNSPHQRHHVRFWRAEPTITSAQREQLDFWQKLAFPRRKTSRALLWLGAASKDTGVAIIRYNAQFTHNVHPDTDAERDLIVKDLKKAHLVESTRQITVGEAYKIRNRVFRLRSHLRSDGKLTIATLK